MEWHRRYFEENTWRALNVLFYENPCEWRNGGFFTVCTNSYYGCALRLIKFMEIYYTDCIAHARLKMTCSWAFAKSHTWLNVWYKRSNTKDAFLIMKCISEIYKSSILLCITSNHRRRWKKQHVKMLFIIIQRRIFLCTTVIG